MLERFSCWPGRINVNGVEYDSVRSAMSVCKDAITSVTLIPNKCVSKVVDERTEAYSACSGEFKVTVKRYMTEKASPGFDFMAKWNKDIPMPLRTMVGTQEKETPGMVYMKLHGDIYAEKICTCMKCGRALTNPVSQYFGIGPECGGHNYVNPFDSDEELKEAVAAYRAQLQKVTWEGWIIKSAIIEREEIK